MIQEENIKFLKSQVMADVPEGGGAATGTEIIDGQMNNVFPDISDLDRAYGRFNLRKLFLAVRTISADLYGGAKSAITQLPIDAAIGYTLFTTNDPFDTRDDASSKVEAYLFKGVMWPGALYENHIEGMRAISVIQRPDTELPPIGKTLCLVQDEGEAGEIEQYVRVTDVEATPTTFTQDGKDYEAWIVTLSLSSALRFNFLGHSPNRDFSYNYTDKVRIRDTTVADATTYYGSQRLKTLAAIGDTAITANSMFTQLVPSAESENPLVSQPLNPAINRTENAGTRDVQISQQAHTLARDVTAENRRYNWIETLKPIPAPGAFTLSFMSQGNWYLLQDDGTGIISGSDPGYGSGTINYTTGAMSVTLGALPDAETKIIMIWGSPAHYTKRIGAGADAAGSVRFNIQLAEANLPAWRGTVNLSWLVGGATRTATDSVGTFLATGMSGYIDYASGLIRLSFTEPPDRGTNVSITYEKSDVGRSTALPAVAISAGTFQMPGSAPWSSEGSGELHHLHPEIGAVSAKFTIGSDGVVTVQAGSIYGFPHKLQWQEAAVGTFNTTTGIVTLTAQVQFIYNSYSHITGTWSEKIYTVDPHEAANLAAQSDGTPTTTAKAEQFPVTTLEIDLLRTVADNLVQNSIEFSAIGKTYQDQNGTLYADIDPQTGSGTAAGTIDYTTGIASITWWADASPVSMDVTSMLTIYGQWLAYEAFFRTAAAPLKTESVQIIATTADGEQITATVGADGNFANAVIHGAVNNEYGVCSVKFGSWVEDATLTTEEKLEDWYAVAETDGTKVFKPRAVLPGALNYNAVAYSYIPLDADILGIDPVRLPSDGRVPIFRPGNIILIMHSADTAPTAASNSTVISAGRTRLAWVRLIDANGDTITSGYTLDRENGTVTITDATGMVGPVVLRHTIADLRMVTDAQINGALTLSRPLSHDFPANDTIVASCLIHGDRFARVSKTFDQSSWNSTWSDVPGTEATATLNLIDYPIEVTNEGTDTDRWVLRWTSSTTAELISEKRGLVWSGSYTAGGADIAPINPRTKNPDGTGGVPYMTIPGAANGGGWSAGNVLRINTVGAIADIWMARSIQQSDEPLGAGEDGCEIYALGNIDRP